MTQSGNYSSSRMADGCLYLFSEFYAGQELRKSEPGTFVPQVNGKVIANDDIYLPPVPQANMYEVITSVDLNHPGETKDSKAIFSKGGQAYVSNENIYFYETQWGYPKGDTTTVRKVAYKNGELKAIAQGKFDGYLKDSFCIDEYEGNLRVVTTKGDDNSVYVLDKNLEVIGSIEGLAEDERVYSARFMGDTGYFVTFRQMDPLFSVDLSDPKKPKILGALKIPGFSEYLHFYGEDRLLGIGMNVDEKAQSTDGVKLTMFDISDKADVKEADTYVLKNVYSTDVSYDYKAALVDQERNLIGFAGYTQGGQHYYLFSYDDSSGFACHMDEEINGNGAQGARGVYIKEVLYVVQGNIIEAYSLEDYKKIGDIIL
ncbi:MAG: beta-propeller domain-containing protein [[Clostridium] scindens]